MKRHINSLLQRKHVEFNNSQPGGAGRTRAESNVGPDEGLQVKDGYDWLQRIHISQALTVRSAS